MKKILSIALAATVMFSSCTKDWLDVNNNPNTPTVTTSDLVFTNAVNVSIGRLAQHQLGFFWGGQWAQSSSFIGGQPQMTYVITNSDFDFFSGYYNNLYDYQYVSENAAKDGRPHLKWFAEIMKAKLYQELVDFYGNVPYTDALKGLNTLQPKYDDAKTIYEDLITKLDAAVAGLNASTVTSEAADIVFKGNKGKWIRFANTVKMRILMRQARMTGRDSYILPEIAKIVSGGGLLQSGEDVKANPGYVTGTAGKINPFYNAFGFDQNGAIAGGFNFIKMSALMINHLKSTTDTFRLKRLAQPIQAQWPSATTPNPNVERVSNYVGVPLGTQSNLYTQTNTSSVGPHQVEITYTSTSATPPTAGQAKDMVIMTAAEAFLLAAEAKQRWPSAALPGSAQSYYEQGVRESFRIVGATDAQATQLLGNGVADADWAASSDKIKAIITQKWIALTNYDGVESWSEYRRSGIPNVPLSAQAAAARPVRLPYPLVEVNTNGANVPQGINITTSRLFWDVD